MVSARHPARARLALVPALVPVLACVALLLACLPGLARPALWYTDDAYIFLRFSRNIAAGLGPVWNPGEAPVEGFTSLLFQGLLAATERLGWHDIARSAWLGVFFALLAVAATWGLARRTSGGGWLAPGFAVLALALSPILPVWAVSGLDTTLYTALLVLAVLAYLEYRRGAAPAWLAGLLFALAALTRPEALAIFALTLALDLLRARLDRTPYRPALVMAAVVAGVLAPVFAWRWLTFGYPFPNTYYAKTGAGLLQLVGGWNYLRLSVPPLIPPLLLVPLAALAAFGIAGRAPWRSDRFYVAAVGAACVLVAVLNGGDHFPDARFLLPALPFLLAVAGAGADRLVRSPRAHVLVRAAAWLVLALLLLQWGVASTRGALGRLHDPRAAFLEELPPADASRQETFDHWQIGFTAMGQALARAARPEESIAVVPIGRIGFYGNIRVIDAVGVVDPHIAHLPFDPAYTATWRPGHDKGDGAYILGRAPDYIQLVDRLTSQPMPEPDGHALQYKSIAEIWRAPEFHAAYEYAPLTLEGGWYYNLYRRRP